MNKLKKILLAGSFLLAVPSCGKNPKLLTEEDFAKADWISAPYEIGAEGTRIWHGYTAERDSMIKRDSITNWSDKNKRIYLDKVAEKNDFIYDEKDRPLGFYKDSILLPDLNGDGYVQYKIGQYATQKNKSSISYPIVADDKNEIR